MAKRNKTKKSDTSLARKAMVVVGFLLVVFGAVITGFKTATAGSLKIDLKNLTVDSTGGGIIIMIVGIGLIALAYYLPKPPEGVGPLLYTKKVLQGKEI